MFWLSKFYFCRLFHTERSWHAYQVLIFCGFCFWSAWLMPSHARAFSLTSFEMLNSSLQLNKGFRLFNFSKILDLHNYKRFYFCPWMLRFPAMFCHAGPCSLAFLARCQILTDSHFQIQSFKSRRMDCSYINYGELRCDSVMISLKAMNFIINSSLFLWG